MKATEKNTIIYIEDNEDDANLFKTKLGVWGAAYAVVTNTTFDSVGDDQMADFVCEVLDIVRDHRDDCAAIFMDLGLGSGQLDEENPMLTGLKLGKSALSPSGEADPSRWVCDHGGDFQIWPGQNALELYILDV